MLGHNTGEFLDLALLLVMGCAIAALVQTLVPRDWLLAVGGAPTLSILSLMLLSLVVSVCSSVDAFLALGFAAQVTPGAVLAFLLLGPVIDLKLIGLFGILLQPRAILVTAAGAGLMVLLIGQWANLWLLDHIASPWPGPLGHCAAAERHQRSPRPAPACGVSSAGVDQWRVLLLLAALELRAAVSRSPAPWPWPEGAAAQLRHRRAGAGPAAPPLLRRSGLQPGFEPAGGARPQLRGHRRPSAASPTGSGCGAASPTRASMPAVRYGSAASFCPWKGIGPSWPA